MTTVALLLLASPTSTLIINTANSNLALNYARVGGVIATKGMNFCDKSKLRYIVGPIAFNGTFYNDRGFYAQNFANGDSASFHYDPKGKLCGGITERPWYFVSSTGDMKISQD
tara:strand:- start:947 stop:1285 length:339 start_codon:yes stop_codon:yes gene_type:complete